MTRCMGYSDRFQYHEGGIGLGLGPRLLLYQTCIHQCWSHGMSWVYSTGGIGSDLIGSSTCTLYHSIYLSTTCLHCTIHYSAAMAGLPGVVVMDRNDLTSPEIRRKVEGFMAGRKADVIMRLVYRC